jgi:hypothetical protein
MIKELLKYEKLMERGNGCHVIKLQGNRYITIKYFRNLTPAETKKVITYINKNELYDLLNEYFTVSNDDFKDLSIRIVQYK